MTVLLALGLTIVIELPLALLLVKRARPGRFWIDVVLINCLTNPAANWAAAEGAPFLAIEAVVVLAEWFLFATVSRIGWGRAAIVALTTNVISASIGLLLF